MPIPGDMTAGRIVTISGTPRTGCKRFTINLECVKTAIKDIAFHIDVRMQRLGHSHQVIRNSCIRGRWGDEEKHVPYFPFQANASFDITILSEHDMFKVAVNNQHFTEFYHRMLKLDRINVINISGDVQLTKISFQ
ncbi:Galectin-related protein A [Mizuhopecten yessoensis]|uniref:Galectin n=2 Tax=Mizuhopecten yessoensis TaxID=6573 RepID=A0A210QZ01_MIZYE|nr:Galectin-related protein A [Mizuhopecten yessoensis]